MRKYKVTSIIVLVLLVLITLFAGSRIPKLGFNYEFESYFPIGDPDLTFYQKFKQVFESDNDFLLLGINNKNGIFQQPFLEKIESMTNELSQVHRVNKVLSPTNLKNPVIGMFGVTQVPYLHVNQPDLYPTDSTRIYQSNQLVGNFFSEDARAISLVLQCEQNLSKAKSDSLLDDIEAVLGSYTFDETHLAGRIKGQRYFIDKMQTEMVKFVVVSAILLALFLIFAFRSFWGVWVPIAIVIASATWLLAFMQLTGKTIDVVTTLLPTILFVVGMSDVVHIVSKYLEELREGKSKLEALKITFKEIGTATFLTSLTTAIGFLTLLTATINPIRDFGQYTAVGVFIAFVLAFTLLPSVLYNIQTPPLAKQTKDKLFWYPKMRWLFLWTMRNSKFIIIVSTVLIAGCIISISNIRVNNFLLEDLQKGDALKEDFGFFEKHFSAVRPFEMVVKSGDRKTMYQLPVLQKMQTIETYMETEYGLKSIVSPLTFVKKIVQAMNGGKEKHFRLPKNESELKKALRYLKRVNPKEQEKYLTANHKTARVSGRMIDYGGYEIKKRNERLDAFMKKTMGNEIKTYYLTGTSLLIDKNNEYLAANLMQGMLIAFGVIALVVGFMYRSVLMVVLSLIPNVFPLLIVAGFMGVAGIDLKVSTSIIFTIAFGIAVDDTIHFLSKMRLELAKGRSRLYAIKRTYLSAGKAIMVTTIILCSGFCTLVFSSFNSIYYIGLLISIALLFAVIADLLLLPALLLLFYGKK